MQTPAAPPGSRSGSPSPQLILVPHYRGPVSGLDGAYDIGQSRVVTAVGNSVHPRARTGPSLRVRSQIPRNAFALLTPVQFTSSSHCGRFSSQRLRVSRSRYDLMASPAPGQQRGSIPSAS